MTIDVLRLPTIEYHQWKIGPCLLADKLKLILFRSKVKENWNYHLGNKVITL